jgi:hypothetical protein
MKWGRHKNKSLKTILNIDKKYLYWLRDSKFVRENQAWLIPKVNELIDT